MAKPDLQIDRLAVAMKRSRLALRQPREERARMARKLAGSHYSEEASKFNPDPLNLISTYFQVVVPHLIAQNPRVMLSVFDQSQKPAVRAMQDWANREIVRINLEGTLRRSVYDALLSVGIVKVALATAGDAANVNWGIGAGTPGAWAISLDDWVCDLGAKDPDSMTFQGHRYRVPRDVAKVMFGSKKVKNLPATAQPQFNQEGDERLNMLGRAYYGTSEEDYEDMVTLWEVYLPRHRKIVTLGGEYLEGADYSDGPTLKGDLLLWEQDWLGHDLGPYDLLSYGTVPDNPMPKGPVMDLVDLHDAANETFRKIIRTVQRMKEITGVRGAADADGNRVVNANDGEMIRLDDPKSIAQIPMGGQQLQALVGAATVFRDMFDFVGGNLSLLGGRSPQAKTASQDRMLNENAGVSISFLQEATVSHAARVLEKLCWYWWRDPQKVMETEHRVEGVVKPYKRQVYPAGARVNGLKREGLPPDLKIDPYSMQHSTPDTNLQFLIQTVTQILAPVLPLLQQQGIAIDWNTLLKKIGEYANKPDLTEVLTVMAPPDQGQGPPTPDQPRMPAATQREYVRHNVSERTRQGSDAALVQSMMGSNPGGRPNQPQTTGA